MKKYLLILPLLSLISCGGYCSNSNISSSDNIIPSSDNSISSSNEVVSTFGNSGSSSEESSSKICKTNWSEEELKIFEDLLKTTSIPFIDYDEYEIKTSSYKENKTVFIYGGLTSDENLIAYGRKLFHAGFKFEYLDEVDGSEHYYLNIDEHTTLYANPYKRLSDSSFALALQLEERFVEEEQWKAEDIAIFEEYLGYSDILYGGYGEYVIHSQYYDQFKYLEIQYLGKSDMSRDYSQRLIELGAVAVEEYGYTHYLLKIDNNYNIKYDIGMVYGEFCIQISRVGIKQNLAAFPTLLINKFINECEHKVPELNNQKSYEYYLEYNRGVESANVGIIGDYQELLSTYQGLISGDFTLVSSEDDKLTYKCNCSSYFLELMPHKYILANDGLIISIHK